MERNLEAEIDCLKAELAEIKALMHAFAQGVGASGEKQQEAGFSPSGAATGDGKGSIKIMKPMHPDKRLSDLMEELCVNADKNNCTGNITYLGVFASNGRQSNWIRNRVCTDDLLKLVEDNTAEKVLHCLGNRDRLNILTAILKKPMSVAEIVETCGFNSTGPAYHHMKPLLAADLIVEDVHYKGTYIIQPHKVQGIIMLLAGICDMVDETYTKGTWDE